MKNFKNYPWICYFFNKTQLIQLVIIYTGIFCFVIYLGLLNLYGQSKNDKNNNETIKVGVLFSLTGNMSISEKSMVDAILLAINEINSEGGIGKNGYKIIPVIEDGASEPKVFAEKAEKLITIDNVTCIFGCWTSASRKTVIPILEKYNQLLWYAVQYEGNEHSRNIIYGGATPNQQIIPALDWFINRLGKKRPYLVGSDYIYPRSANIIIKNYLNQKGLKPVGEVYHTLGDEDFEKTVKNIKTSGADFILNTLNGESNVGFFFEYYKAGLESKSVPIVSFSIAEDEIRSIGSATTVGHYAVWNYFQNINNRINIDFVHAFKTAYGNERVTDDPIATAYSQVYLFARAITHSGSVDPNEIYKEVLGLELDAPSGILRIDPNNQNTWKFVSLGKIRRDGQFDIIWTSKGPIKPEPYELTYSNEDINFELDSTKELSQKEINSLKYSLVSNDFGRQIYAARQIADIGITLIPFLINNFTDKDHNIRCASLLSIELMGNKAESTINSIIPLLNDNHFLVRERALRALIEIGKPSKEIINSLDKVLSDDDPIIRHLAIAALKKLTPRTKEVIPELTFLIKERNFYIKAEISSLIFEVIESNEDKLNVADIPSLNETIEIISKNIGEEKSEKLKKIISHLETKNKNSFTNIVYLTIKNIWIDLLLIYILLFVLIRQIGVRFFPYKIHKANIAFKPYTTLRLPWLGINNIPIRSLLIVGVFQYHNKVLDSWVKHHINLAKQNFEKKGTVQQRKIYVQSPIKIDKIENSFADINVIKHLTIKKRWCILISGEGGVGKTSLACEMARWAMSDEVNERLCPNNLMIPILLEPNSSPYNLEDSKIMIQEIMGQLKALISETDDIDEEFLKQLLKKGRILVIADDIKTNPVNSDFPAAALIVTSREQQLLGDVPKVNIYPQKIYAEHLSTFLHAYLTAKDERSKFSDTIFFGACQRLSAIVRERNITALLAKMYAELVIGNRHREINESQSNKIITNSIKEKNAKLPKDILDLMVGYIKELNRRKDDKYISDEDVLKYFQLITRNALNNEFHLDAIEIVKVKKILGDTLGEKILDYFESKIHLIYSIGTKADCISFTVEPIAEYMAAIALIKEYSDNEEQWRKLIRQLTCDPNMSFILALWDCVLSIGRSANCPEWLSNELANLTPKHDSDIILDEIKIGILHSITGTMAISERSLIDSVQLAVEEINMSGGLLGKKLVAIVEDGASEPSVFARKAEKLIIEEKVCSLFGCWTSASRKAVLSVVEENDHLLFYPLQCEGFESSKNVIYTGASPNQQILPAVEWCIKTLNRKRMFLVGSDYIFPRKANEIIRRILPNQGGECCGEIYRTLGNRDFREVVKNIIESGADVILNTINGDSNIAFFKALNDFGITPDKIPVISFSFAEDELKSIGTEFTTGHYCAWNYFQSIDTVENEKFVNAFKSKYGEERVTDDPIEAAYLSVYIFAKAVEKTHSIDPRAVREACRGIEFDAPGGIVRIDPENQHTWTIARVGKIRKDGNFDLVWSSSDIIEPDPYLLKLAN